MGKPETRPYVLRRDLAQRQHRREQGLARLRLLLAAEPSRPGRIERGVALARARPLDRVAAEVGIIGRARGILDGEQSPLPALAKRLQPLHAQAICKRRALVAGEEAAHDIRVGIVQLQSKLPVFDVGLKRMALELRSDPVEADCIARAEGVTRQREVRIARLAARVPRRSQ